MTDLLPFLHMCITVLEEKDYKIAKNLEELTNDFNNSKVGKYLIAM